MNGTTRLEEAGAELRKAARDASLVALARTYPNWSIQQNSTGGWSATQRTDAGETVEADDLIVLAASLAECDAAVQLTVPSKNPKIIMTPASLSARDER